jgi:replication factor C subunit 3/5
LRFCQLPKQDIIYFLKNIIEKENIQWSDENLNNLLNWFKSDIRSMINYLQSNHQNIEDINILKKHTISDIVNNYIISNKKITEVINFINKISLEYNTEIKTIIKEIVSFILRELNNHKNGLIDKCEYVIHNINIKSDFLLSFFIEEIRKSLNPLYTI